MNREIKYKGYTISQTSNNHIMITKDNECAFHAQANKKYTEEELEEQINWFIKMKDLLFNDDICEREAENENT